MTMSNDSRQLESIIADTNKLIELAEEGHWENVIELEKKRAVAIGALFETQPNIETPQLAEGIQYIIDKNNLLAKYSHSQRDSLRMEMSKAAHAHKAINTYLQAT